jgi:hypothetical protein
VDREAMLVQFQELLRTRNAEHHVPHVADRVSITAHDGSDLPSLSSTLTHGRCGA